jgi:hypothetical protein
MTFNINDLRADYKLGGVRPTQFSIQLTNPSTSTADIHIPMRCTAASLPASNLGVIQVPYFGRMKKLAGDRVFSEWTVTMRDDEDFAVRDSLETWSAQINALQANIRGFPTSESADYQTDATVTQFSKKGDALRTYTFINIWPQIITAIPLDWGQTDTVEYFQVVFQYDEYYPSGKTGNAGGFI